MYFSQAALSEYQDAQVFHMARQEALEAHLAAHVVFHVVFHVAPLAALTAALLAASHAASHAADLDDSSPVTRYHHTISGHFHRC
ncbi:MAG: hypothetical protein OQK82_01210, partial [Candidatus Pacearchaeota archaeon]|nr:hypothetical protein [Candidatus Pacearchaeota archaeon]